MLLCASCTGTGTGTFTGTENSGTWSSSGVSSLAVPVTPRNRRPLRWAGGLLTALALANLARADEEPIDLSYRAYEGCPSERQFLEQVVGRAAKTLVASERARGRKFVVTVAPQRKEAIGKLEIVAGETTASREVTGANCTEVVSALALFTALAIDPNASMEPAPSSPAHDETGDAAAPPAPSASSSASPLLAKAPTSDEAIPEIRIDGTKRNRQLLAGAHALGLGAFDGGSATPSAAWGGAVFAQWITAGFGAYRLNGAYFVKSENDQATFRLFTGRLDACPLDFSLRPSIVLEPCLAFELGRVEATAKRTATIASSTQRRWWVAGDVLGRLRYGLLPGVFAELEGGLSVPFTRHVFILGTETDVRGQVHRVPVLGWVVGLGLGARIL